MEIQNSPISADEILEREQFYEKMIWILNAKRFAQNLEIIGFNVHMDMNILKEFIVYEDDRIKGLKRIKIVIPPWDDRTIENCLLPNKGLYQKDEEEENIWYINDVEMLNGYEIPTDLRSAFLAFALHDEFSKVFGDDHESYRIDFRWRYIKRSWLNATMPIFLDIGPRFMIYLTEHNYGNDFEGKVITKKRFLGKYRKRLPE